ncbi:hypothetical protein PDJAM_G00191610 [Pangasius djambal]|uniref:Uncharacterized protein n=1 Tax=Pangasius djambal TaxID=1691987 RepID=A0ACC5Y5L4_9TELE|nr:hypothetical protein [Pangasius djambal]
MMERHRTEQRAELKEDKAEKTMIAKPELVFMAFISHSEAAGSASVRSYDLTCLEPPQGGCDVISMRLPPVRLVTGVVLYEPATFFPKHHDIMTPWSGHFYF